MTGSACSTASPTEPVLGGETGAFADPEDVPAGAWAAPFSVLPASATVVVTAATGDWLAEAASEPEPPGEAAALAGAAAAWAAWPEPPWFGLPETWVVLCSVLLAALTVATAAATGAFAADDAADVTVDVTAPTAWPAPLGALVTAPTAWPAPLGALVTVWVAS